jgi:tetratricopeptide (TPR) repeat protein
MSSKSAFRRSLSRLSRAGGTRKKPVRYAARQSPSELLAAALRAHRKGQLSAALAGYQERLSQRPDCLDALMNSGALHAQSGRATEALSAFSQAGKLAPTDARVFRDIGLGLKTIGRWGDAARALEHSVQCSPELVGSWLHLALLRLEVAERASAIEAALKAVRLQPEDPSTHFVLARCEFDASAPGPAIQSLARAQRTPKGHPEAGVLERLIARHCLRLPTVEPLAATSIQPAARDLADAAEYLLREVMPAQLFSSARATLRAAASLARPGPVLELGVFHGVSLRWLSECAPGPLHGFDTFWGLPASWGPVPEGRFTTAGRIPEGVEAQLWVGPFEEQLPLYRAEHGAQIALLHVDSDLYESARSGLQHLAPLLGPGSMIVFDEYFGHRSWRQDEHRAFQEAVALHGWRYEATAANPFTGQVVMRLL